MERTATVEQQQLMNSLDSGWSIIKAAGKVGASIGASFFKIVGGMVLLNMALFIYGLIMVIRTDFSVGNLFLLILSLIISGLFVLFAAMKSYRYAFKGALAAVLEKLKFVFYNLSDSLVAQAEPHIQKGEKLENSLGQKMELDLVILGFNVTKIIAKKIKEALEKSAVLQFLIEIYEDLKIGNRQSAVDKLGERLYNAAKNRLVGERSLSWLYWLVPLNIAVIVFYIHYLIVGINV